MPVAPPPVVAPVAEAPAPAPDSNDRDIVPQQSPISGEAALLALLAALGLGGAGVLAMRARRRREDAGEFIQPTVAPIVATPAAEPAAFPEGFRRAAATPEPVLELDREVQPARTAPMRAASPERFAMPAGPVPTGEDREALLERMVTAPPDEANPFTSAKARRRRARLILQSRAAKLAKDAREPFDWRTYKKPSERQPGASPVFGAIDPATV